MSPDPSDRTQEDARAAVLGYLAEYPDAMETFDGIAEWWIARHQIRVDVERLWRAIQELIGQGILEEVQSGNRACYRLKTVPRAGGWRAPA